MLELRTLNNVYTHEFKYAGLFSTIRCPSPTHPPNQSVIFLHSMRVQIYYSVAVLPQVDASQMLSLLTYQYQSLKAFGETLCYKEGIFLCIMTLCNLDIQLVVTKISWIQNSVGGHYIYPILKVIGETYLEILS